VITLRNVPKIVCAKVFAFVKVETALLHDPAVYNDVDVPVLQADEEPVQK